MNTYSSFLQIMPRSQNAHAIVNAGFLYELNDNNVVHQARIVFGGLSSEFIRASATETFLKGKSLFTNKNLQAALKILESELIVTENPPEPTAAYRKKLALGLFFKVGIMLFHRNVLHFDIARWFNFKYISSEAFFNVKGFLNIFTICNVVICNPN